MDLKAGKARPPGSFMLHGAAAFAGHPVSGNGDSQRQTAPRTSLTPHLTQVILISCLGVSKKKSRTHLLINQAGLCTESRHICAIREQK